VSTVIGPGSDCTACSYLNESAFWELSQKYLPAIRCVKLVMREAPKQMTLAFILLSRVDTHPISGSKNTPERMKTSLEKCDLARFGRVDS
jgi:hypothetical protein